MPTHTKLPDGSNSGARVSYTIHTESERWYREMTYVITSINISVTLRISESKLMWSKTRFAVLAVMLIALVSISQTVKADAPVIVGVYSGLNEQPPFVVGQSFTIAFEVTQPFSGTATATVKIDKSQCAINDPTCHIWTYDSPISVESGKIYNVHPPGISTPGNYKASVLVIFPPPGAAIAGYAYFQVEGSSATPATDWAVLSVSLSPSAPQVGDPVTFKMVMTALSSPGPFPQSFSALCVIDGASCGGGSLTYPGPAGTPFPVSTQTTWIATLGKHTLAWGVATIPVGLDPNKGNNAMSTSFTVTPQAQFDFSISTSPTQQSVVPGGSASYAVTVNLVSGTAQSVALSLSTPPLGGVSVSFAPTSGTPPFSSTLSVTTTSSASPGTITLTISGIGGGASHSAPVTLIVSQAPDFQIDVSQASQSVLQGETVSYNVNVAALNGFNSQVDLTVSGLPSGANGVFSSPSGTPNFASTLTVTLPASVSIGSFTLTITGNGGGQSRVANVVLTISQASQTSTQTTSTQTSGPPVGDLMSLLQQNGLLILAAVVIIVLLAVVASRRRKPSGPAPAPRGRRVGTVYCPQCGAVNPVTNEFCGKCGTRVSD